MKKLFAVGLFLSLIFALSHNAAGKEIPLPTAEAYQKAVLVFGKIGAIPIYRDNDLKMIKTDMSLTKLTIEECDCGGRFGIPFIKDRKVRTLVGYQVQFINIDDKNCNMDLRITIDGYVDVGEGKKLKCKSTGVLEKKFEELLLK